MNERAITTSIARHNLTLSPSVRFVHFLYYGFFVCCFLFVCVCAFITIQLLDDMIFRRATKIDFLRLLNQHRNRV